MTNYQYINSINSKLVLYRRTNTYYINIGPLFGLNESGCSIFIILGDKILKSYNETQNDIYDLLSLCASYSLSDLLDGTSTFKLGKDYLISESLYNFIISELNLEYSEEYSQYILPDFLIDLEPNVTYYSVYNSETNIEYYNKLNAINDFTFSKEELDNFYITFAGIILDNTELNDFSDNKNYLYNTVLNYWRNGAVDAASSSINMVLGSSYLNNASSTYVPCGCNTNSNKNNGISLLSCFELYSNAMKQHLIEMLGNSEFYNSWFLLEDETVNEVMITSLEKLIDEFLALDYNLVTEKTKMSKCNCETISAENNCNTESIYNYKNVLSWVKNNIIQQNKNKIKIYGEAFGELLPNLNF